MKEKYDTFEDFLDDYLYQETHRNQAERYQEAAYKLDSLVRKIYDKLSN